MSTEDGGVGEESHGATYHPKLALHGHLPVPLYLNIGCSVRPVGVVDLQLKTLKYEQIYHVSMNHISFQQHGKRRYSLQKSSCVNYSFL